VDIGGNKAVRLRDQLAYQHRIPFFHDGFGWLSNMLAQREHHFPFRIIQAQTDIPAQLLVFRRMDTAAKSISHSLSDSFQDPAALRLCCLKDPRFRGQTFLLFYQTKKGK
jgi:hypothetical protein